MKAIKNLELISEKYYSPFFSVLRIILGLIIWWKGIVFISDTAAFHELLINNFGIQSLAVAYFIAGIHLFAGFFLIAGLMTRLACLIQIPMVLGAILFINNHIPSSSTSELILSLIALILLVVFLIFGSGKFSVYYYMINSRKSREMDESRKQYVGRPLTNPLDNEGNVV